MAAPRAAGEEDQLVYVSDQMPGISRRRCGSGFAYVGPDGRPVRDATELQRIRRLAIPPAYRAVWICPLPHGHLQATGRDARGRKQYRYHERWRELRDADKFDRMAEFGRVLPRIRERVARDLAASAAPRPRREIVLAALVRLLDTTLLRVGNDEYARLNGSYGLTTLRDRHAAVEGDTLKLGFRAKSGVEQEASLRDRRVARIVQRCQALPGQVLFQYEDEDGALRPVGSTDVNAYLREVAGGASFSAKDFRTWHASVLALQLAKSARGQARATARAKQVLEAVAVRLGNTPAVCRKAYVHPAVLDSLLQDEGADASVRLRSRRGLAPAECELLAFLAGRP